MRLAIFMSEFEIDFSWEAPGRAKGPELRATWAQLKVSADNTPLTQVVDYRAKTIRDSIYLPLYPLAEWIATHWWWLLYEMQSPGRPQDDLYVSRHNFAYAREGYALPDLSILPIGGTVILDWHASHLREQRVRFVTSGRAVVELRAFEAELVRLVEATLERLAQEGLTETFLHGEWQAIRNVDRDERDFCRAAAQLGLEGFAISADDAQALLDAAGRLPAGMGDEFFSVATPAKLSAQTAAICDAVARISGTEVELPALVALKAAVPPLESRETPWKSGYELANHVRDRLQLNGSPISTLGQLREVLGIAAESWAAAQAPFRDDCTFVDALVAVNKAKSPGFLIEKRREDSRMFAFCRALCEYLALAPGTSGLISETRSQRQQLNRAFAAEFLAPAESLRQKITGRTISEESVDEIAAEYGTSPFVIRHQLENHGIAEIVAEA